PAPEAPVPAVTPPELAAPPGLTAPLAAAPEGARAAARAPVAAPRAAPTVETPLARELRSLDEARSALGRGDASGALAELDRHDRAFPSGSLRTEARVLRAEVLLARGDRAAAQRIAAELLARDPSGPHARRLRTIAEGAP
ncbi:MAG TPA: hypothetical protein VLT33_43910, partial [Labilithrix sp.]|nr:hypothetical protein [Labilithrix sp.]